jgi:hypothetical protein
MIALSGLRSLASILRSGGSRTLAGGTSRCLVVAGAEGSRETYPQGIRHVNLVGRLVDLEGAKPSHPRVDGSATGGVYRLNPRGTVALGSSGLRVV